MTEKEAFKPGNRKYLYAIGRRKRATAQVRLYQKGSGKYFVNEKPLADYFQNELLTRSALEVLSQNNLLDTFDATVLTKGGGKAGQADAVRLAVARALLLHDPAMRTQIKHAGFLKRDPRVIERKKPGLRKARRAPQWSKR